MSERYYHIQLLILTHYSLYFNLLITIYSHLSSILAKERVKRQLQKQSLPALQLKHIVCKIKITKRVIFNLRKSTPKKTLFQNDKPQLALQPGLCVKTWQ